jgi:hypothetical protein
MINIALLLAAISAVESGDNDFKIGKAKEVSRYQMLPAVWADNSRWIPTGLRHEWTKPAVAREVTTLHINWLRAQLPSRLQDDPGALILSWKKGAKGARRLSYNANLAHPKTQDYCERVWNLYREKLRDSGI